MVVKDCPHWEPHITVATVVEDQNKFLFVEEWSGLKKVINQPAGHVERGENIVEACVRETFEETGYCIEPTGVIAIQQWHKPHSHHTFFRFAISGKLISHAPEHPLDDGIIRAMWLTQNELIHHSTRLRSPLVMETLTRHINEPAFSLDILQTFKTD